MLRKYFSKISICFFTFVLVFVLLLSHTKAGGVRLPKNIHWNATAILLDGIEVREKYLIPVKEAVEFISSNSRFKVQFAVEISDVPHTYTFYYCGADYQQCVLVNKWDLDPFIWDTVPIKDFYMLLWDTAGNPPLLAGGTWGVADGVFKGALNRPYITIPVDPWWYNNEPFEGFSSRAAQIMTHEIINAINAKLEVEPYNCNPLVADPGITYASEYEASRLSKLTDDCYLKYLESYHYEEIFDLTIDIKPGSYPNSINLKSKGKVPVAILTTNDFDAYDVDPETCVFAGAYPLRWKMEDVDDDGDYDMLFHFMTRELDLIKTSTEANLVGETIYGDQITGTDSVNIVPKCNWDCNKYNKHDKKTKKGRVDSKKVKMHGNIKKKNK
jgi:hypothetical protein